MPGADTTEVPAVQIDRRRVLVVMGALMLGMLLAALDQTIVSTALPTIVGDLHGASHLSWIVTAYLLAATVSTPLWGKLGDLYGRKGLFQASIVIFLIGSILSGLSQSMLELIVFRALQGLGGGGLMIGAQAIVGDIVSPRERGRYVGLFGAVFGVATVLGPLLGGLFVDYLSWRWVFYINIPLGIVALFVTAAQLPGALRRVKRVVDYLGTVLLSLGATALVLFTSLGGTSPSYGWTSPFILSLVGVGVVLIALFALAERRAVEPVVPLGLFRNRVFAASSAVGFVVGFAMFGALTFLPLFLQIAKGVSPTMSGIQLLPLMGGLLVASIGSGQAVTRWGRYRVFPIAGTALMALGLYLISLVGVHTAAAVTAAYMVVFGVGLGLVMQVLVVAVQNAVPYEVLGVATSGATFFRQIGGSFGTAVFGAIYANVFVGRLDHYLPGAGAHAAVSGASSNPAVLDALPPAVRHGVVFAVADTIHVVFLVAVPIAALAFLLSWLIPEVALRKTIQSGFEEHQVMSPPQDRRSIEEIEHALETAARRENRAQLYRTLAERAGLDLDPRSCWLLYRLADQPEGTVEDMAARLKVRSGELEPGMATLAAAGLVATGRGTDGSGTDGRAGHPVRLTDAGRAAVEALTAARHRSLTDLLEGWDTDQHPELVDMVRRLARTLLIDDAKLVAEVRKRRAAST